MRMRGEGVAALSLYLYLHLYLYLYSSHSISIWIFGNIRSDPTCVCARYTETDGRPVGRGAVAAGDRGAHGNECGGA